MSSTEITFTIPSFFGKDREVHVEIQPMRDVGERAYEGRKFVAERRTHGRVFVFGEPNPEDSIGLKAPPYGVRGQNAENDNQWDLYNAEQKRVMRLVTDKVFAEIEARGLGAKPTKLAFSKYAGCSMCPCSPGFVAHGFHAEVFVNFKVEAEATTETEKAA